MIAHTPGGAAASAAVAVALLSAALAVVWCRGPTPRARRRAGLTAGGLVAVAVAVSGPAESLAEQSFTAHMIQHLVLMVVAPGLLIAGRALTTMATAAGELGLPRRRATLARRWRAHRQERDVALLVAAAIAHAGVLTFWHLPAMFAAAVESPAIHAVEHATMFAAGLALFAAWRACGRRAPVAAFAATFATAVHGAALGALITFAGASRYAVAGGMASLADQQVAGLLMWVPAGAAYVGLAVLTVWQCASVRVALGARPDAEARPPSLSGSA